MKTILAADCGSTTTTAVLIEKGENGYHLQGAGQAPSTYGLPWEDITLGVRQAVRHIEKLVERTLLAPSGWPITPQNAAGHGVDAFIVVTSAGEPLQLLIAGLMQEISLASAQSAVTTTYARPAAILSLDTQTEAHQTPESQIQAVHESVPELILLVGGTEGGATRPIIEIAQVLSMALQIWPHQEKPGILYAGNSQLRPEIADILGPITALNSVSNLRPTLDIEDLTETRQALEKYYLERKMSQISGFDKLKNWTKYPIVPAGQSFEKLITYLGQRNQLNVIGVNIGSRSTMASMRAGRQQRSIIRSDAGIGHSLELFLKLVPLEKIQRWVPFELTTPELYNHLLNKTLRPTTIPDSYQALFIEHAVARELLRLVVSQTQRETPDIQWHLIIGAGRTLTGTPQAALAALTMIDGVEPWGVASLALDQSGVVNMLGAIAAVEPLAAATVAAQDAFLNLGTVVAPTGHGTPGKAALTVKVEPADEETVETEIMYGSLALIPLPAGQKASLEIRPTRHFDIGLGQPGRGAVAQVEGGVMGIIIDARGRPLKLPQKPAQRIDQLQQWLTALNIKYQA